ncbi:UNVERIFIED_CONTAM: hypothetical protein PYX00_011078 [Menopon gallinae]|uniref:Uncharacterized protein n=1 Tax=Menopon gallinae TaxID=328185 RepID=A0AAW2H5V4_9NEOP
MDKAELKRRFLLAEEAGLEYGKDYKVLQHGENDYEIIAGPEIKLKKEPKSVVSKLGEYIKDIDKQGYSGDFVKDLKLSFKKTIVDPMTWASLLVPGVGAMPKVATLLTKLPTLGKYFGGIATTGAATGGMQVAKNNLTQDNNVDPKQSAITAGILAAAMPLIAKRATEGANIVKNLVKPTKITNKEIEQLVNKAKDNNIVLKTPGQELGTYKALELEQLASKGKLGNTNKNVMNRIIEAQNESIANKVDSIVGGKVDHNSKRIASEGIKKRFNELKKISKQTTEEAYEKVVPILEGTSLDNEIKGTLYSNLKKHALNEGIDKEYYGAANQAIKKTIDNIKEATNLLDLEKSRRLLAKEFKYLDNSNKEYLMRFKNELDNNIDNVINNHVNVTRDGLEKLKNARDLYSDYMEKFVTPKNHSISKFYKILNNENTTGSELLESVIKDKSSSISVVKRLKELFGEGAEEINHLKRAYVYDSLGKTTPEGNVLNIKDASKKIHQDFGNDIASILFNKKEIEEYKKLANDLYNLKTLPKEDINLGRGAIPEAVKGIAEHHTLVNPISWVASPIMTQKDLAEIAANSLDVFSRNSMQADLKMGGNRITGVKDGVELTDVATVAQASGSDIFAEDISNDASKIDLVQKPAQSIKKYENGLRVTFIVKNPSVNKMHIQLNGLGYKELDHNQVGIYYKEAI